MPQYLKMFVVSNVYLYQFWCFYHKVNDWFGMLLQTFMNYHSDCSLIYRCE